MQIFIHCKTTLHISGVTAPIIRSIKNCTHSLRCRSYYLYRYSPPKWSDLDWFLILLMMGAVTPETCTVVLQWINICMLLYLLDFYSHRIMMHGTTNLKSSNFPLQNKSLSRGGLITPGKLFHTSLQSENMRNWFESGSVADNRPLV